tara:strand:+ start:177 stop:314 length:138 start_codon:yes stop_codon:yes gene_type:complete
MQCCSDWDDWNATAAIGIAGVLLQRVVSLSMPMQRYSSLMQGCSD